MLCSVCVAFAVAECYFRFDGTYATYSERYGESYSSIFTPSEKSWYHIYEPQSMRTDGGTEFSYSFRANNEGLLDKTFSKTKSSDTIRVMMLGDSFIQGIGAPYDSSCPKQLEKMMHAEPSRRIAVEVWNCGVGGSDPFFGYVLLANNLWKYKPDMVVVAINATDISDVILRGGMERFRKDSTVVYNPRPWFEPVYGKSFLTRRIVHDVLGFNWLLLPKEKQKQAEQKSVKQIENSLTAFQRLCDSSGIPLVVAFQPMRDDFKNSHQPWIDEMITFCHAAHIKNVDVKKWMEQKLEGNATKIQTLYWPVDGHFKSVGYTLYAECLQDALSRYIDSVTRAGK